GGSEERLRGSPLLESFASRGIEVLIGQDEIDELVFSNMGEYQGMTFKSVNHVDSEDELGADAANASDEDKASGQKAVDALQRILGERIKSARVSKRLQKSPSCVVMDKDDPTMQYSELMQRIANTDMPGAKPILEVNPSHLLVKKLAKLEAERGTGADKAADQAVIDQDEDDIANILLDEALLVESQRHIDPRAFIERLNRQLSKL
ncbi:MAG: molecular chaperone HtpG, partial [Spirochaetaceae bacterium]|nr:molecular chaperone HtpG [Spirochaetaceae bacterium]